MSTLPYEVREAIVQVFGKAFWLKDPLRGFIVDAGVPGELFDRFAEEFAATAGSVDI